MGKAPLYRLYICLPGAIDIPEGGMEYGHLLALHNHLLRSTRPPACEGAHGQSQDIRKIFRAAQQPIVLSESALGKVLSLICVILSAQNHHTSRASE